MSESRSGRPISIYADASTAKRAEAVAAAENRKLGQLGGEALAFWTSLPAAARAALRYIQGLGTAAEVEYAHREVARALLLAQRAVASERAGARIRAQFEDLEEMSDAEIEELAVRLSEDAAGEDQQDSPGSLRVPAETSSNRRSRSATS